MKLPAIRGWRQFCDVVEGIGHCALGYAAEPLPACAPRKPGRIV